MHSEKEILDALNVLKNMCATTEYCKDCPVGRDDGHCTIRGYSPVDWNIEDEDILSSNKIKTILLLGKGDVIARYIKNVLRMNIHTDVKIFPDATIHHTEFHRYVDEVKETKPPVITTQNSEMVDVFLNSDLDFDVVTVRRYSDNIISRTLSKEEALDMVKHHSLDLRD